MKRRKSLSRHILLGCLAFTVVLSLCVGVIGYHVFRQALMPQYEARITDVLNLTLSNIDGEDLEACMASGTESQKFKELTAFLDQVIQSCALDYLVICQPVKVGEDYDVLGVVSGLQAEERAGVEKKDLPIPRLGDSIGEAYPKDFIPVIYDDMINRQGIKFSTSNTGFGHTFDGACAIYNEEGEGIALLTAGLTVQSIHTALGRYLTILLIASALLCILLLVTLNMWLRRRIICPLQSIEKAAVALQEKSREDADPQALIMERPDVHTGDELESLADTLMAMTQSMRDYVERLLNSKVKMQSMQQEITRVNQLANRDGLTGVRNKAAFDADMEALNEEIVHHTAAFGIVMLDVNDLKPMNDTHGHDKGDLYLKNTCKLICDTFSHSPVYRIGGDEFVVVLKNVDLGTYSVLEKRLRKGMRKDEYIDPWERVSIAVGMATYNPATDATVESVWKRADEAMYEDKRRQKAQDVKN